MRLRRAAPSAKIANGRRFGGRPTIWWSTAVADRLKGVLLVATEGCFYMKKIRIPLKER